MYPVPLRMAPNEAQHRQQLADSLILAMGGKINATTTVTLTAGTETVLIDHRISATSFMAFMPTTASAAGAMPWVSAQQNGQATISHPAGAADRVYRVLIIG